MVSTDDGVDSRGRAVEPAARTVVMNVDYRFSEWLTCPVCEDADADADADVVPSADDDGTATVGIMIHRADVVLECYACGQIDEFVLGEDVPFQATSSADLSTPDEGSTD